MSEFNSTVAEQLKVRNEMLNRQRDLFRQRNVKRSESLVGSENFSIETFDEKEDKNTVRKGDVILKSHLIKVESSNKESSESLAEERQRVNNDSQDKHDSPSSRTRLRRSKSRLRDMFAEEVLTPASKHASYLDHESHPKTEQLEILSCVLRGMSLSTDVFRRFLSSPCPQGTGMIQCFLKRHRTGSKAVFPEFSFHTKDNDVAVMRTKNKPHKSASTYVISIHQDRMKRQESPEMLILGKLKSEDISGSLYSIYEADQLGCLSIPDYTSKMGKIIFAPSTKGIRKTEVYFGQSQNSECKVASNNNTRTTDEAKYPNSLRSKKPKWRPDLGCYTMDFGGRVTMRSKKNCQLEYCDKNGDDQQSTVVYQFGRVEENEFSLDFQWPLSPFFAFAIAIAVCNSSI